MKKLFVLAILLLASTADAQQQMIVGIKSLYLFDNFNITKQYSVQTNTTTSASLNLQEGFRVPKNRMGEELFIAWQGVAYTYTFPYEFRGAGNIPADFIWGGTKFPEAAGKIVDVSGSVARHRIELEVPLDRYMGRQSIRPLFAFDLYNSSLSLSSFDNNNKQTYGSETWSKSNLGIGLVCDTPLSSVRLKGKFVYTFLNGSNGWYGEAKVVGGFGGMGLGVGYYYNTRLINFGTGDFRGTTQGPYVEVAASF